MSFACSCMILRLQQHWYIMKLCYTVYSDISCMVFFVVDLLKKVHLLIARSTLRFIRSKVSSLIKLNLVLYYFGSLIVSCEVSMSSAWGQRELSMSFDIYGIILGQHDVSMMLVWDHIEVSMSYVWGQYYISILVF